MAIPTKYSAVGLSDVETERVKLFREKCVDLEDLTEEQKEDAQLLRWLKARNMDIEKAYKMLQLSLEWRKENKVDGILERETFPRDYKDALPFAVLGVNKDGHLVMINPMGRQDFRRLVEKYGVEEMFKYHLMSCEAFMEIFRKKSKEYGIPVTKCVQICDFEGYSIKQLTSKLARELMVRANKSVEPNYPDILHSAVVVNAPKIFGLLFNLLKPFIPKETLEKVEIYGPEPEKWKKAVAEKFPLEMVPEHWGGTRKGSDEYCSQDDIWFHGPVPISFFTGGSSTVVDEENLRRVTIPARGTHKISLSVTKPDSSIAWRFRSDNHDIGFRVGMEENGKEQVILPFNRVQSQKEIIEGNQVCADVGTYSFVFDNTYSMYRAKTVYYNVSILEQVENQISS